MQDGRDRRCVDVDEALVVDLTERLGMLRMFCRLNMRALE